MAREKNIPRVGPLLPSERFAKLIAKRWPSYSGHQLPSNWRMAVHLIFTNPDSQAPLKASLVILSHEGTPLDALPAFDADEFITQNRRFVGWAILQAQDFFIDIDMMDAAFIALARALVSGALHGHRETKRREEIFAQCERSAKRLNPKVNPNAFANAWKKILQISKSTET